MGFFPLRVEESIEKQAKDTLRDALSRIRLKERNLFLRQLANLCESGMMITRALRTLVSRRKTRNSPRSLTSSATTCRRAAASPTPWSGTRTCSPHVQQPCARRRNRGMLEEVLWRICAFGEQEEELRGKAVSAMVYPAS
jgi:type II secretory pathway component PulF